MSKKVPFGGKQGSPFDLPIYPSADDRRDQQLTEFDRALNRIRIEPGPWKGPDLAMLAYLRGDRPIVMHDLLRLWEVCENYVIMETVIDLATRDFMPIWAAWEMWSAWWRENYQPDSK